jgi:hypothetical protein
MMFWGKLWIKIKGDLFSLREDIASGGDLGQQAESFLDKLERRLGMTNFESHGSEDADARIEAVAREIAQAKDLQKDASVPDLELERAWDELRKGREPAKEAEDESPAPPPNPRKLG